MEGSENTRDNTEEAVPLSSGVLDCFNQQVHDFLGLPVPEREVDTHDALTYFSYLTGLPRDQLFRESGKLVAEEKRVVHDVEAVALKNYKTFVKSCRTLTMISEQGDALRLQTEKLKTAIEAHRYLLAAARNRSSTLALRRKAMGTLLQRHQALNDMFQAGTTIESCVKEQLVDEALQVLHYLVKATQVQTEAPCSRHESHHRRQFALSVERLVVDQARRLKTVLFHKLQEGIPTGLADLTNEDDTNALQFVMTYLLKVEKLFETLETPTSESLEVEVLRHLAYHVESEKKRAELIAQHHDIEALDVCYPKKEIWKVLKCKGFAQSLGSLGKERALLTAVHIVHTDVTNTALLFLKLLQVIRGGNGSTPPTPTAEMASDSILSPWIALQTQWLISALDNILRVPEPFGSPTLLFSSNVRPVMGKVFDSTTNEALFRFFRTHEEHLVDLPKLRLLYERLWLASEALTPFYASFFALAFPFVDHYLKTYIQSRIYGIVRTFEHDTPCQSPWAPLKEEEDSSLFQDLIKPDAIDLLQRLDPLGELMRLLIPLFNDLRLCALHSLAHLTTHLFTEALSAMADTLMRTGQDLGHLDIEGRRLGCWSRCEGPPRRIRVRVLLNMHLNSEAGPTETHMDRSLHTQRGETFFLVCWILAEDILRFIAQQLQRIFSQIPISLDEDRLESQYAPFLFPAVIACNTSSSLHPDFQPSHSSSVEHSDHLPQRDTTESKQQTSENPSPLEDVPKNLPQNKPLFKSPNNTIPLLEKRFDLIPPSGKPQVSTALYNELTTPLTISEKAAVSLATSETTPIALETPCVTPFASLPQPPYGNSVEETVICPEETEMFTGLPAEESRVFPKGPSVATTDSARLTSSSVEGSPTPQLEQSDSATAPSPQVPLLLVTAEESNDALERSRSFSIFPGEPTAWSAESPAITPSSPRSLSSKAIPTKPFNISAESPPAFARIKGQPSFQEQHPEQEEKPPELEEISPEASEVPFQPLDILSQPVDVPFAPSNVPPEPIDVSFPPSDAPFAPSDVLPHTQEVPIQPSDLVPSALDVLPEHLETSSKVVEKVSEPLDVAAAHLEVTFEPKEAPSPGSQENLGNH